MELFLLVQRSVDVYHMSRLYVIFCYCYCCKGRSNPFPVFLCFNIRVSINILLVRGEGEILNLKFESVVLPPFHPCLAALNSKVCSELYCTRSISTFKLCLTTTVFCYLTSDMKCLKFCLPELNIPSYPLSGKPSTMREL